MWYLQLIYWKIQFWCCPGVGNLHPIFKPHLGIFVWTQGPTLGHLQLSFQNKMTNARGDGHAWNWPSHFAEPSMSTTEFSIDGSWLNKRKLPSSSLRRNFSFLTTSTPSTAAITSPEKSHAFARSSCSHRLMFFFGVSTKGTKTMMIPDRSSTKTYKLIIGNSDTFSGSILSAANFGIRDSSLRSFRILFMIFSSFTSYR